MSDDARDLSDLRAATVRGLRWVMFARPTVEGMLLASMVVLARLISPAEFGRFATVSLISGFGAASVMAITTALVQRRTLEREHLQAANALALAGGAVLVGLMLLAATFVIVPIFGGRTAELVRLSAPGALVAAVGAVPFATLQRRLAFRRLSVIDVAATALRVVTSVALAIAGLGGAALVFGALAGIAVQTTLACLWAPPPAPRPYWRAAREVLHFGTPNWFAAVSWIGFANCDYAIVGARLGAQQAGFYFRAYTLGVEYQKKVSSIMGTVGLPVLARTRNSEEMGTLRGQMVCVLTVVLFPCLALLALVAPVAVPWVFGEEWRPAVQPTQLLAIGGAATIVIDAVGTTLMASGRPRAVLGFGWAHFAAYAAAVFFATPYGLTGVAAAAATVHGAFVFVAYALMLQNVGKSVWSRIWEDIAPALCSCAALLAAALPVSLIMSSVAAPAGIDLAIVVPTATLAYLVALRMCFPSTWRSLLSFARYLLPHRVKRTKAAPPAVDMRPASASAEN
jgi:lipopolysaccharide exporter